MEMAAFKAYVAEVVARHFEAAPLPDGTAAINRVHMRLYSNAYREIKEKLDEMPISEDERWERELYADDRAMAAVYALFPELARKPRRYK